MVRFTYRIECRSDGWGDGSWDPDAVYGSPETEDEARTIVADCIKEDAVDGAVFEYRIMRRQSEWETVAEIKP